MSTRTKPSAATVALEPYGLERFAVALACAQGMHADDAATLAEILLRCDLRGIRSHGMVRLPVYLRRMAAGGIDPAATPEIVRESGATALVDAHNANGHVAARFAMRKAIELAERHGIGAVGERNSNHFGPSGEYALQAAAAGMIGIVSTNAAPCMAPWGGIAPILGNNPIAFAAPRADGDPFVLDFALSQVAKGWVRLAFAAGRAIPAGWAMDAQGRPTTDAAAAMKGLLNPIGAYKGTGLSIAMDILCGILVGSTASADLPHQENVALPGNVGHFFIAIQIERFIAPDEFERSVGALLDRVEGARRAPDTDAILIPGKIEGDKERAAAARGYVELAAETWSELLREAERLGVGAPTPLPAR
ncbi:MAG: Ldh family oxidoreductase [Candidatus Eremiobacteraeota bacterium]|nr:Ldh family oxidoreductase [Candidatus Eremiobacteraeota bacterium]